MYHNVFKDDTPTFLQSARDLITLHGDWYVGEYFSYFKIWGSNTVHLLPRIVPDRMVSQEFSFQTVADGAFPKLAKHKKKCWPKFPLNLGSLVLHNSTHGAVLGKEISIMNLGEAPKIMHDPKPHLASLFAQERAKFHYTHEEVPDDSICREAINFSEALEISLIQK